MLRSYQGVEYAWYTDYILMAFPSNLHVLTQYVIQSIEYV